MFCPSCGAVNEAGQSFCRACGLNLDPVTQVVADQFPTKEYAAYLRQKELLKKAGLFSFSIAGLIAFFTLLFYAAYYKMIIFGPDLMFWSATAAFLAFLLLSAVFYTYTKLFMKFEKGDPRFAAPGRPVDTEPTTRLIEDRPFEPVPSAVEDTTELLVTPKKKEQGK
jgi:hypothetical protein